MRTCPPFGPLPAPFIAGPIQRPREWLIIAGVTALLILALAIVRRRLIGRTSAKSRRLVMTLLAIGFGLEVIALAVLIVGLMPWHDAMYAAHFPQLAQVAEVADHRVCFDALDHHFYAAQQAGDLIYNVSMSIMSIVGAGILVIGGRFQRKLEAVTAVEAQPVRQG